MKLKYFSEQTFPKMGGGTRSTTPKVNFSKAGVIEFNKPAVELLELKPGDKVTIAQDEEDAANWYVFKDKNGFEIRSKEFEKHGKLAFNHRALTIEISKACDVNPDESQNFLVAGKPTTINGDKTKYWGLLLKAKV